MSLYPFCVLHCLNYQFSTGLCAADIQPDYKISSYDGLLARAFWPNSEFVFNSICTDLTPLHKAWDVKLI